MKSLLEKSKFMNVITQIATALFRGSYREQPLPREDRSRELGVHAAEIQTYMHLNVPRPVYQHRIDDAQEILAELVESGSFNLARFEAGYKTLMDRPYLKGNDILKLERHFPALFDREAGNGTPSPAL